MDSCVSSFQVGSYPEVLLVLVVSGLVLVEWNGVLYVFDGIHQPMILLINKLSIMYSLVHIYRPFLMQGGLGVHAVVPYGELFSH